MVLAVDVGNSTTKVAVFEAANLVGLWRLSTRPRTADELSITLEQLLRRRGIDFGRLDMAALCSVVPYATPSWEDCAINDLGIPLLEANHRTIPDLVLTVDNPAAVGADRLVNAFAASHLFAGATMVVSLGTATTLDVVREDGRYLGGVIAPGVGISARALFRKAAQVKAVPLEVPASVLPSTSFAQVQSGIMFGTAAQIDGLAARIQEEVGGVKQVVATGGYAEAIAPISRTITTVEPLLTLRGLQILTQRQGPRACGAQQPRRRGQP